MSIFQTLNVAGPANRGQTIQNLAQKAAQGVLRRQRMRALLQNGAAMSGAGGAVNLIHSSLAGHPTGSRGQIRGTGLSAQQIAAMLHGAGAHATFANGRTDFGGMFRNGGNGGFDFGSLPDPSDPRQAAGATDPTTVAAPPPTPGPLTAPPAPTGVPGQLGSPGGAAAGGGSLNNPGTNYAVDNGGAAPDITQATALVPLGGGLFYDPATDSIRGGGPLALQSGNTQLSARAGRPV